MKTEVEIKDISPAPDSDPYEDRMGSYYLYKDDEVFILSCIDGGAKYLLISLEDGNYWANGADTPLGAFNGDRSDFVKLEKVEIGYKK